MLPLLRFTLDLFSAAPEPQTAPPAVPTEVPPVLPLAVAEPWVGPYLPPEPLQQAIDPTCFRHPRANRELRIAQAIVFYEFARARRRTIGFSVGPDGLSVRAPRWTPVGEVEAALLAKSRWILDKLGAARDRRERLESARIVWREGATIPYLGNLVRLQLDPEHRFVGVGAGLSEAVGGVAVLRIGLPHNASETQIRDAVQAWLMREARQNFDRRIAHFAPLLQVQVRSMRLSNAGTRWGSASSNGTIRLNWRLIHFRQPVVDYVIAHELSHLRVMDHSPRFWETVASVVPDYSDLRRQLKDDGLPRW